MEVITNIPWANNHRELGRFAHELAEDFFAGPDADRRLAVLHFTMDDRKRMMWELKNGRFLDSIKSQIAELCRAKADDIHLQIVD